MPEPNEFFRGEHSRTLDERYRLSVPSEWADRLAEGSADCILAKERPGCLSLWNAAEWEAKLEDRVELIERKLRLGELDRRISEVQMFGRLLSTRQKRIQLAGRGRLLVPEGFREFLAVEPGAGVLVVGAAVCVEIWNPAAWVKYLEGRIVKFRRLFDHLSR
jgi:MraZ protein